METYTIEKIPNEFSLVKKLTFFRFSKGNKIATKTRGEVCSVQISSLPEIYELAEEAIRYKKKKPMGTISAIDVQSISRPLGILASWSADTIQKYNT